MKLTPENIAAIEDLLARREKGEANPKLASSIGLEGKSGHNKISQFVSVLRVWCRFSRAQGVQSNPVDRVGGVFRLESRSTASGRIAMESRPPSSNLTKAEFAAIAPTTEAILFLQNVTGLIAVDCVRDATGELVGVVARGKRNLSIELRFQE